MPEKQIKAKTKKTAKTAGNRRKSAETKDNPQKQAAKVISATELQARVDEYFEQEGILTLTGLALHLGISLSTLQRHEAKIKTHAEVYKKARDRMIARLEGMLYDPNRKSVIGPIFALKALAGWDDGAGRKTDERSGGLSDAHKAIAARSKAKAPPKPQDAPESTTVAQNRQESPDSGDNGRKHQETADCLPESRPSSPQDSSPAIPDGERNPDNLLFLARKGHGGSGGGGA